MIDPGYKNPSALVNLQLSNKKKTELAGLEKFKNLTDLDISGNLLTTQISETFSLKYLKKLNLANNQISALYSLPIQLENLNLSQNLLNRIESNLTALASLHTLDLSSNKLTKIQELGCLTRLKCLYLNNNLINDLCGIERLANLAELDVSENELKEKENIRALNVMNSLVVVNIENNPVVCSFQLVNFGFALGSAEEFPGGYIEISLGIYFRSPEKLRKLKSSRYRGVIKEYKNKEKLLMNYASPDWRKLQESVREEELTSKEVSYIYPEEESEELFGKKVINIAKLDLEKINEKICYEKSSTKPESSLESLFEELISYCKIEESKENSFSADKYENAINTLKVREDERKCLAKGYEKNKSDLRNLKDEVEKMKEENEELVKKIEDIKEEIRSQDIILEKLTEKKVKHESAQTEFCDDFYFEGTLNSGLSSFSQLPGLGSTENSKHIGGSDYMVHSQIGVYVQKLLSKISNLVKKKKKILEDNRRMIRVLNTMSSCK